MSDTTPPAVSEAMREAVARKLCTLAGLNPDGKAALIRMRFPYLNWQMYLGGAEDLLSEGPIASEIARLTGERDAAREDAERLTDEHEEARHAPWPKWTTDCLKLIRDVSGYDGYDDETDGVDLPEELAELISELRSTADKVDADARASRKVEQAESAADFYRKQAADLRADLTRMREENEHLSAALEPFACEAERYDPNEGDDHDLIWGDVRLRIGQLRQARAALSNPEQTDA